MHKKCFKKIWENVRLSTKLNLRLKKSWGNFKIKWKNYCVAIKKVLVIQFPQIKLYDKIFFQKTKTSVFSSPDCFIRIKQPQKLVLIFFQAFFDTLVWQAFLDTLDVSNCMISIFGIYSFPSNI